MLTKYCHGELHGADKLEFCFQESVAEAWRSGRFQGWEARPLIVTEGAGALTAWGGGAAEGLGVR